MKKLFNILLLCAITISMNSCMTRVGAGYTGVKWYYAGDDKGKPQTEPVAGWVGYTPGFSTVIEFPTNIQHYVWTANSGEGNANNEEISIPMKGGASFLCDVGFNYSVQHNQAGNIYFNYRTDDLNTITQGYLRTTVRNCMTQISGTITMDSLLNNIPAYEQAVRAVLSDSLYIQGFELKQFALVGTPRAADPAIAASINNKIKAKQDAETEVQKLQSSIAISNQKIADARGDSASAVIRAAGEAEAIKKKQVALSPTYVDYIKASTWNGILPTTMLGSGTNFLYSSKQ